MADNRKKNINLRNLVIFSSLSIVLIAWFGTLLAVLGIFKLLIPILLIIAVSLCILALTLKIKLEFDISRNETVLLFSVVLLATANGYFYHETIDHGRDPGMYIGQAIDIAKKGNTEVGDEYMVTYIGYLKQANSKIALLNNRVSEIYTSSIGYNSFLAFVYQLFGIYGIFWSNTIFFLLFLLIMYLIGVEFGNTKIGLIFIALFSTHYLTIWFTRRTNTETFFMFLLWLVVYLFLRGYNSKKKYYFYFSLFPLSIIPLVRLEGFLYYIPLSLLLLFIFLRERAVIKNILLTLGVIIFLSIPLFMSDFIQKTVIRIIQQFLPFLRSQSQQVLAPVSDQIGTFGEILTQNIHRFTFEMFTYYLLTPLCIVFIIYLLKRRYNFIFILLLVLISPALYFLINPSNSPDQPWFMRRFWPHIVVLLFFVPSIIVGNMKLKNNMRKFIFATVLLLMLFSNLIYSSKIIIFSEDRGLVEQLNNLDKKLPNDVYILGMETKANAGFLIPMHFLFDRQIINNRIEQENKNGQEPWRTITIEELARFIPADKEVILISPRKDIPKNWYEQYFNHFDFEYLGNHIIRVPELNLTADILGYQKPIPSDIQEGKTKVTYAWIEEKSKETPPTNISIYTYELSIFKVYSQNNKLDLYRKNISLIDGWERKGDDLSCSVDECYFKSLIWNNSITLNISYVQNSTANFILYNNISKSNVNMSLKNTSLSILISSETTENKFAVTKGALIKNISARYSEMRI
jgi:hypothetical protein